MVEIRRVHSDSNFPRGLDHMTSYRLLGRTGLRVSPLALGTMPMKVGSSAPAAEPHSSERTVP